MTGNPHPDRDTRSTNAIAWWDGILDSNNLDSGASKPTNRRRVDQDVSFASSPDRKASCAWLENQSTAGRLILDLGAGLGSHAFAFARRGHRILAIDSSISRMQKLMERARVSGCADRILPVVGSAENLPLGNQTLDSIFTKSVLIHVQLGRAARELFRILDQGGRAACVEPGPRNPFARLYRKTAAPREWAGITRYLDHRAHREILMPFNRKPDDRTVAPFYGFSFLAFIFQYAIVSRPLFHLTLGILNALDRMLFRICPALGKWAWFHLIRIEKQHDGQ